MALAGGALAGAVIGGLIAAVLVIFLAILGLRWWLQGRRYSIPTGRPLAGKVAVVTGANTGIGKVCAQELCRAGAKVVLLCRSVERGEAAAEQIRAQTASDGDDSGGGDVRVHQLDLASLASVRACAEQLGNSLPKIDILLNNAGVMACPYGVTEDGLEMHMAVNHFGHFLLTNLLMPLLKRAADGPSGVGARVVNVSSEAHKAGRMNWSDLNYERTKYHSFRAYAASKLANVLFTRELARKAEGSGVTVYALHPGVIKTELTRHMDESRWMCAFVLFLRPFMRTVDSGARTSLYCCTDERLQEDSGKYYSDCVRAEPSAAAQSDEDAKKLWEVSEKVTQLNQFS